MNIMEKIDLKLNESSSNVNGVADAMTRAIMGEKRIAISQLEKLLPLEYSTFGDIKDYNKVYGILFNDIKKAINKSLKSAKYLNASPKEIIKGLGK